MPRPVRSGVKPSRAWARRNIKPKNEWLHVVKWDREALARVGPTADALAEALDIM